MIGRIWQLSRYYIRSLTLSLLGLVFIIGTFLFWAVFFPPGQGTPDAENYILVIAAFGAAMTFLVTLTIAARANRAENMPLVARLPSRVEYLTAVFTAALFFSLLLQFVVAALALIRGPEMAWSKILEAPPIWIAMDLLVAIMALHASDLVASGWSRVVIYGTLAILLIGQSFIGRINDWLLSLTSNLSAFFYAQQFDSIAELIGHVTSWLSGAGESFFRSVLSIVFWPFQAIGQAIINGYFTPMQALAPSVLILYAAILFLVAADLFASKDLEMIE
ncbi:MAG: hypothetical protein ACK2UR_18020 [Candidatus Promineifilaceae bacterium]